MVWTFLLYVCLVSICLSWPSNMCILSWRFKSGFRNFFSELVSQVDASWLICLKNSPITRFDDSWLPAFVHQKLACPLENTFNWSWVGCHRVRHIMTESFQNNLSVLLGPISIVPPASGNWDLLSTCSYPGDEIDSCQLFIFPTKLLNPSLRY